MTPACGACGQPLVRYSRDEPDFALLEPEVCTSVSLELIYLQRTPRWFPNTQEERHEHHAETP
jgi:hypothetical protein